MKITAVMIAGMAVMAAIVVGAVNAQVDQLPPIAPLYSLDTSDIPQSAIDAYMVNPEGALEAAFRAIDDTQTVIDELWIEAGRTGRAIQVRDQIYAYVVSLKLEEATHYLTERGKERGITFQNDPKYFQSLNVLRQYQGLEELIQP